MRMLRIFLPLLLAVLFLEILASEYLGAALATSTLHSSPFIWSGLMALGAALLSVPLVLLVSTRLESRLKEADELKRSAEEESSESRTKVEVSDNRLRQMMQGAPISIVVFDRERRIVDANIAAEKITGHSLDEMRGRKMADFLSATEDGASADRFREMMSGAIDSFESEKRFKNDSGEEFWGEVRYAVLRDANGEPEMAMGQYLDLTEQKQGEDGLRRSYDDLDKRVSERTVELQKLNARLTEEVVEREAMEKSLYAEKRRLSTIAHNAEVGLFLLDDKADVIFANDLARSWFDDGQSLIGRPCWQIFGLTDPEKDCVGLRVLSTGNPEAGEAFTRIISGEDRYFRVTATPVFDEDGNIVEIAEVVVDLTERKLSEQKVEEARSLLEIRVTSRTRDLLDANVALLARDEEVRAITESANDAIVQIDHAGLVSYWNRAAEQMFGYSSSEAMGEPVESLIIPEEHRAGHSAGFAGFRKTGDGKLIGHTLELSALHREGRQFPIELSLSAIKTRDGWSAMGVMRDISERKEHEERLNKSLMETRLTLEGSVRAMSLIVESRDPYTAGHQARVAEIASTIAADLGLPEDEVEHIRIAALVHDIGKIHLPAEILSKPGRLSSIEFDMIRTHSQVGFDILDNIAFAYPIADVAHQHHERNDGSGYPQGLKGDQIHIAARIVAVADVLEAMASHRPYRAALGMQAALEEITAHRGSRFDSDVVDSAIRIYGAGVLTLAS